MKKSFLFCILFCLNFCFSENTNFPNKEIQNKREEEDKILAEIFRRNAIFYQLNENEEIREITGDILSCEFISNNIKKKNSKEQKAFFCF